MQGMQGLQGMQGMQGMHGLCQLTFIFLAGHARFRVYGLGFMV